MEDLRTVYLMDMCERTIADDNRAKVAAKTLTMPDAMVGVMGGPSKKEAVKTLLRLGYKVGDIKSFLRQHKHSEREINSILGEDILGIPVVVLEDCSGSLERMWRK